MADYKYHLYNQLSYFTDGSATECLGLKYIYVSITPLQIGKTNFLSAYWFGNKDLKISGACARKREPQYLFIILFCVEKILTGPFWVIGVSILEDYLKV